MSRKSRLGKSGVVIKTPTCWEKVGIYTRASVSDGGSTSESIKNQETYIKKYISEREDFVYVKTYVDDGHSGLNFNRPAFLEMLRDIENKKVNCVIVKDLSRLGRNYREVGIYLLQTFPRMGVRMISINDNYDNKDREEELWNMSTIMNTVMNHQVSADISKRVSTAINTKVKEGTYLPPSGSIPYGYLRDAKHNTFAIDAETWLNVRRIYKLREEGRSYMEIAKIMNEQGIPSPGKLKHLRGQSKKQSHADAMWHRGIVKSILHDQAYTGCRVHGKVKKDGLYSQKHTTQPDDWTIIENAHPAIVPKELFDQVQEINQRKSEKLAVRESRIAAVVDHRALFRGKLFCGNCGKAMKAEKNGAKAGSGKDSVIYYDCSTYIESSRVRCSIHYIRDDVLTNTVAVAIIKNKAALCGEGFQLSVAQQMHLKDDLLDKLTRLHETEVALTEEISGLKNFCKRNQVPEDRMNDLLDALREERSENRADMDQCLSNLTIVEKNLQTITDTYELVKNFCSTDDLSKKLMDMLISQIEIFENKTVRITFTEDIPAFEMSYA